MVLHFSSLDLLVANDGGNLVYNILPFFQFCFQVLAFLTADLVAQDWFVDGLVALDGRITGRGGESWEKIVEREKQFTE